MVDTLQVYRATVSEIVMTGLLCHHQVIGSVIPQQAGFACLHAAAV